MISPNVRAGPWSRADPNEYGERLTHRPRRNNPQQQYKRDHRQLSRIPPQMLHHGHASNRVEHGSNLRLSKHQNHLGTNDFDDAIQNLEEHLAQAITKFGDMAHEFSVDVQSIAEYAGQDIMDELWRRKVKYRAREEAGGCREQMASRGLGAMVNKLEDCIEEVSNWGRYLRRNGPKAPGRNSGDAESECKLRLARKLEIARSDLIGLLKRAPKYQDALKGFLTEAELVQTTIRTVSQGWRYESETFDNDEHEVVEGEENVPPPAQKSQDDW